MGVSIANALTCTYIEDRTLLTHAHVTVGRRYRASELTKELSQTRATRDQRMRRVDQPNHCDLRGDVAWKKGKDCFDESQENKPKRKKNSSPFSYIEVISYAILSAPQKQATLTDIYTFIQAKFPEFTANRARWKNTVRHNLSLKECFQRVISKAKCYWYIHPSFLPEFCRGDFSRRKLTQDPCFEFGSSISLHANHFILPYACTACPICEPSPFLLPNGSPHYQGQSFWPVIPLSHWQQPYFLWNR